MLLISNNICPNILEAELGSNPLYLWRSLLQARDIIIEGSKWKEGSGTSIDIVKHQWLPRPPCFRRNEPWPSKVRELVDEDTKQWDRAKLAYWYEAHTCADILSTPLSNLYGNDVLVWKENKSKIFSVKSMYGVAQRVLNPSDGDHSMASADERLWKSVWSFNTPPKVRNSQWRACSNILPTRDNLCKKKVQLGLLCVVCKQQSETVSHILWECPFARNVWALVRGKIQKSSAHASDFFTLTRTMLKTQETSL